MFLQTRKYNRLSVTAKLIIILFVLAFKVSAQDDLEVGVISGSVLDAEYGDPVSVARVNLAGTSYSAITNLNGKYLISDVPFGEYTLIASAVFYKSSFVESLKVDSINLKRVDIPIYGDDSNIIELDAFSVKAEELAGSDMLLQAQRSVASSVSDLIGSEAFSKFALGDAAAALGKVTGVSISDGKYMVVRGLSDRYNNTTMNGATVPSADPDKRAVQLDQFPTGIIDGITVVKTFVPDKSGNFTGGYVDIKTKSVPDRGFMKLTFGVSHNSQTTFKNILSNAGGSEDWLGRDDGSRALPILFNRMDEINASPRRLDSANRQLLADISNSFSPELVSESRRAPLNRSASISFGNRYVTGEGEDPATIGIVGSITNKRGFSYYDDGVVGRFELNRAGLVIDSDFTEEKGVEENEWGSILNMSYRPNSRHEIGINTSNSQSGSDEAISRYGSRQASGDSLFRVQNIHYTERSISMAQLYGNHQLELLREIRINWFLSESSSTQEEPDFRLFYDELPDNGFATYKGNFSAPRRYWRNLEEDTSEYKIDLIIPIGRNASEFKFGILNTETTRDFTEDAFIYKDYARGFSEKYRYDGDISEYLSDGILSLNGGEVQRYIAVAPGAVPKYNGTQLVEAAYLMTDLRFGERWRFIGGARYEKTEVEVQSFNSVGDLNDEDGFIDQSNWLPALNVVYKINEKANLRFAATKTLARPNFRELSPFGSFDNIGGETFVGNPDLLMSNIDNFDLRWEIFPESTDVLAATIFTKLISNPIELNFVDGELTYVNVESAEVLGIELEARKGFSFSSDNNGRVTIGGNLSYVDSEVSRSEFEIRQKSAGGFVVSPMRELQGQSEVVGNLDVSYEHYKSGSNVSLSYNYTGERLYSVSLGSRPDVYEAASGDLDLIWSQKLSDKLSMKIALRNLLDDGTRKFITFNDEEAVYSEFHRGLTTSLSFSYDFF